MKKLLLFGSLLVAALSVNAGVAKESLDTDSKKVSYIIGQNYGSSMFRQFVEVDVDTFMAGFKDGYAGLTNVFSEEEMQEIMTKFQAELRAKAEIKQKELAERNLKKGKEFLDANKAKEGIKTTESGLQYKVVQEGSGEKPTAEDTVTVNYRGTTLDGTEFDSSYKRNKPATFPLKGVIKGWTEGLQLMKTGAKYEFYIPAELAYGERGNRGIEPNSTLIFEVELISFTKPEPAKPVTSDIVKIPSKEEMEKGAKPEIIKKDSVNTPPAKKN